MFRSTCVYRTEPVENKPEITKTQPRHATATSIARAPLFRPRFIVGYLVGSTCRYTMCIFRYSQRLYLGYVLRSGVPVRGRDDHHPSVRPFRGHNR